MVEYWWLLVLLAAATVVLLAVAKRATAPPTGSAPAKPDLSGLDDEAFRDRVLGEIEGGRKIEAIRLVRERTRMGLADAKALVEALASGADSVELDLKPRTAGEDVAQVALHDPDLAAKLILEVAAGRKLEAIRLLREKTGLGLKEAKDAIEALERDG